MKLETSWPILLPFRGSEFGDASLPLVLGLLVWLPGKQNLAQQFFQFEHWAIAACGLLQEAGQYFLPPSLGHRLQCLLSVMSCRLLFRHLQEIETGLAFAHQLLAKYLHSYFPN